MPKQKSLKEYLPSVDIILLLTTFILVAFGIIMIFSASAPSSIAETKDGSPYTYVKQQVLAVAIGIFLMFFVSKVSYKIYHNKIFLAFCYFGILGLLLMVRVPRAWA
jgi:cell division protein FtsW